MNFIGNSPLEQKILVSNICVASIPNYMRAMKAHCPIRTKYIPNLLFYFRLLGIFRYEYRVHSHLYETCIWYLYTLYILIGVGFRWVFFSWGEAITDWSVILWRISVALHISRVFSPYTLVYLLNKTVEDFLLYRVVSNLLNVVQTYRKLTSRAENTRQ
jgi:hypothetical protein